MIQIHGFTISHGWRFQEMQMRKLTLTLAAAACLAFTAPAFASMSSAHSGTQLVRADMTGQVLDDLSAAKKKKAVVKKKKKGGTTGSGAMWGG